ncbi:MAG: CBS domain-containing protein [Deltaproteobacteria bacterium]|nr:CBS domain-containing protein [Deltaproteobacteria bacterium]
MLTAADIMTRRPVTILSSTTVAQAVRTLDMLSVRHLPVVNEDGELVGMVSDRDLRGFPGGVPLPEVLPEVPAPGTPVVEIMTGNVVQAAADDPVVDIAALMVDHRVGAIPIVDPDSRLEGIVSYVDILRALVGGEELPELARPHARAPPPRHAAPCGRRRRVRPGGEPGLQHATGQAARGRGCLTSGGRQIRVGRAG